MSGARAKAMAKRRITYAERACDGCGKTYQPTGARQRNCPECKGRVREGINARRKARRASTRAPRRKLAGEVRAALDTLVDEAVAVGREQVCAEVLKRSMQMREALIRSRHENAKLRAELEVQTVSQDLAGRG